MRWMNCLLATLLVVPLASFAEVQSASRTGFSLRIETVSHASAELSYEAFTAVDKWWDMDHSYGGVAENLSLQLTPGGALLETLEDGGFVKHLEVAYLKPGVEIRLLGGLGPLQPMGMHGAMTIQFEQLPKGSKTVMTYNVTGYYPEGLENLAPIVDRVQAGQMQRHAIYADQLWFDRKSGRRN